MLNAAKGCSFHSEEKGFGGEAVIALKIWVLRCTDCMKMVETPGDFVLNQDIIFKADFFLTAPTRKAWDMELYCSSHQIHRPLGASTPQLESDQFQGLLPF